jgi:hypothetical protein
MVTKPPPIPKDSRSPKGPSTATPHDQTKRNRDQGAENPEKRGQTANTRQNTTNQGYQQDR